MFGTLVANRQLLNLMASKEISIEPFNKKFLKETHYTLHPGRVLGRHSNGKWVTIHDFEQNGDPYVLEADEYVVVEVRERIKIFSAGLVGRFVTASNNIEGAILVVAGQIDNKYGTNGEMLRFGVKNLLKCRNELRASTRLAHAEFFDLRGVGVDQVDLTDPELLLRAIRMSRAVDDGPLHLDPED